jgi:hypothetical protein
MLRYDYHTSPDKVVADRALCVPAQTRILCMCSSPKASFSVLTTKLTMNLHMNMCVRSCAHTWCVQLALALGFACKVLSHGLPGSTIGRVLKAIAAIVIISEYC